MKPCNLILQDEVNCKFEGIDIAHRRSLVRKFKYHDPSQSFTPAVKMGFSDGCVRFFSQAGATFIQLLEQILPEIKRLGYDVRVVDQRAPLPTFEFDSASPKMFGDFRWPKGHTAHGEEIILRDYQVESVRIFLENMNCMQELSTGAGKTLICAALSKQVERHGRTLIIVPKLNLVNQTAKEYRNLNLDVGTYGDGKKEPGHLHTIATWQTLSRMRENDVKANRTPLPDFNNIQCIILDEAHTAKAPASKLRDLLSRPPLCNVPIRWGVTGTIPKHEVHQVILNTCVGNVKYKLPAHVLQGEGTLATCKINILQFIDEVGFENYAGEKKYLVNDVERMDYLSRLIEVIVENHSNTLVLVDHISTGKLLADTIPNALFVSGSMHGDRRQDIYDSVDTNDNVCMIATYGVAATGINMPRIFNLVLLEPGKAYERVIQSIGRSIRIARDSSHATIWDICSTCRFSARHLKQRLKYYKEARYPFEVQQIDWKKEMK